MTDENGHRSIPIPPEPQEKSGGTSYVEAAQEQNRILAQALARQSDCIGRKAVEKQKPDDFIAPVQ